MGLVSGLLLWPLIPVRGVVSLGELIQRRVDSELHDPARTRRQLEELEEARERDEISAEEEHAAQEQILKMRVRPDVGPALRKTGEDDGPGQPCTNKRRAQGPLAVECPGRRRSGPGIHQ
ncbi:gas vesicle protein GvpG [Mycolicibacterium elephantis]|nr:gas vesicle protein GvpG [Mycolicibacterium elephantis]